MLTTGQTITNNDSYAGTVAADNLVRQMVGAGKTWKAYAESLPSVGWTGGDQYPYVKRHNPFAYLTDVINSAPQANNLVPFSQFAGDLANNQLPNFSYLLPNQLNNGHDCPNGSGCTDTDKLTATDNWLNTNIAPLLETQIKYGFRPEMVSAFSANEVLTKLRAGEPEYKQFLYREATLNQTNPANINDLLSTSKRAANHRRSDGADHFSRRVGDGSELGRVLRHLNLANAECKQHHTQFRADGRRHVGDDQRQRLYDRRNADDWRRAGD